MVRPALHHRMALLAVLFASALGLSGCFDLAQNLGIGRDGSGQYRIAVSAQGIIGQALKDEKLVNPDRNHARFDTTDVNGRVTRTATVDFKSLSDLALSSESISLRVTGRDFFGFGQSHVALRASFMVDKARGERAETSSPMGREIAQSILGDHSYVYTVTVPGDIERVSDVAVGGVTYRPEVKGDFYNGRTVTWRLPLYAIVDARALDFEVDFVALGSFRDATTRMVAKE